MMERIEIKIREKIQKYADLLELYENDPVFMKKMTDKQREIRQEVKNVRTQAAKEREQKLLEDRMQKNIEKRKKKELIVADYSKRQMYRSPQPLMRVFKKKIEQTEGE